MPARGLGCGEGARAVAPWVGSQVSAALWAWVRAWAWWRSKGSSIVGMGEVEGGSVGVGIGVGVGASVARNGARVGRGATTSKGAVAWCRRGRK